MVGPLAITNICQTNVSGFVSLYNNWPGTHFNVLCVKYIIVSISFHLRSYELVLERWQSVLDFGSVSSVYALVMKKGLREAKGSWVDQDALPLGLLTFAEGLYLSHKGLDRYPKANFSRSLV